MLLGWPFLTRSSSGNRVPLAPTQVAPECLIKEAELEKLIAKAQPFVPPSAAPSPAVPPQC